MNTRSSGQETGEAPPADADDSATGADVDRIRLVAVGLLLVTMPAVTLVAALGVLAATQSVVVADVTFVEALELYLIELGAFVLFAYLLYRVTVFGTKQVVEMTETESGDDDHDRDVSRGQESRQSVRQ